MGFCNFVTAELRGVKVGLNIAWMGLNVILEVDSTVVQHVILQYQSRDDPSSILLAQIEEILNRNWNVIIKIHK